MPHSRKASVCDDDGPNTALNSCEASAGSRTVNRAPRRSSHVTWLRSSARGGRTRTMTCRRTIRLPAPAPARPVRTAGRCCWPKAATGLPLLEHRRHAVFGYRPNQHRKLSTVHSSYEYVPVAGLIKFYILWDGIQAGRKYNSIAPAVYLTTPTNALAALNCVSDDPKVFVRTAPPA